MDRWLLIAICGSITVFIYFNIKAFYIYFYYNKIFHRNKSISRRNLSILKWVYNSIRTINVFIAVILFSYITYFRANFKTICFRLGFIDASGREISFKKCSLQYRSLTNNLGDSDGHYWCIMISGVNIRQCTS